VETAAVPACVFFCWIEGGRGRDGGDQMCVPEYMQQGDFDLTDDSLH
jgi:hypothetical protein